MSVFPYFVLMGVFLAVGNQVARNSRFYAQIASPATSRFGTLDGLRGILALGVFFHHAVITRNYYVSGTWEAPDGFYGALGPRSVGLFFVITGFLFWSKAIHNRGRIPAAKLYKNRLLRIAPMYVFVVLVMLVIAAFQSGLYLHEPITELLPKLVPCFSLGIVPLPSINGVNVNRINAGVFWTLQYEWGFYLVLPLLALLATPGRLVAFCMVALPGLLVIQQFFPFLYMCVYFVVGMVAAQVLASGWPRWYLQSTVWPIVAICASAALAVSNAHLRYQLPFCFILFVEIARGSFLFGLLRWPGAAWLGTISYSVYLLHGIVLFIIFRLVSLLLRIDEMSQLGYWSVVCGCGLLTILLSGLTYRFLEHPFLPGSIRSGEGCQDVKTSPAVSNILITT